MHIKHLYASGEDQQEVHIMNSQEALTEITVNEANIRENRGWYRGNREFREHSQDLWEMQKRPQSNIQRSHYGQPSTKGLIPSSENSESSQNLRTVEQHAEGEK